MQLISIVRVNNNNNNNNNALKIMGSFYCC